MKKLTLPTTIEAKGRDFVFGVATSSFQIEGARDLRLDSIWDTFCARQNTIADGSNGDVACDHVARWEEDLRLLCELNVDAYRFSVSWPRVMHQNGSVNEHGMRFYETLIDALRANGIKVYITLYHWDLPQYLEDEGGWLNRNTAEAFAHYVHAFVSRINTKADAYITLNEPFCAGYLGYEEGVHAPGLTGARNGRLASHHLLLAHGLAMQEISAIAPTVPAGIVVNVHPGYPLSDSEDDKRATRQADDYLFGWYLDPILKGSYPDLWHKLAPDILPAVAENDMAIISAKIDFLGLNYYTRNVYRDDGNGWYRYVDMDEYPKTEMGWEITPHAFTDVLLDMHRDYPLPPVYITENGAAMPDELRDGRVCDESRIAYFQTHLDALAEAMAQGVDVRGYFAWSLLDNFEWALGYSKRFGIVYTDYQSQQRILKDSAHAYRDMLYSRK
jgi:beta-glucosidase